MPYLPFLPSFLSTSINNQSIHPSIVREMLEMMMVVDNNDSDDDGDE